MRQTLSLSIVLLAFLGCACSNGNGTSGSTGGGGSTGRAATGGRTSGGTAGGTGGGTSGGSGAGCQGQVGCNCGDVDPCASGLTCLSEIVDGVGVEERTERFGRPGDPRRLTEYKGGLLRPNERSRD